MLDPNLHCLLYVSSATRPMSPPELEELLAVSRAKNLENDVTGVLLYADGSIMQMLEGPRDIVQETFARVARSRRHKDVIVMLNAAAPERIFSSWSMAYSQATWEQLTEIHEAFQQSPEAAIKLLRLFVTHTSRLFTSRT